MVISMIAAMAQDRVIGKENQMPWHLPADFAWFKQCTLGKPVVMGRKTYQSIGRPLPGRQNIVISRDPNLEIEGVSTVTSIEQALALVDGVEEVMIIGGGSIYQSCLQLASRLYLTHIDLVVDGDTQFPQWGGEWTQTYSQHVTSDEKNAHNMQFVILERNN
ncbi:type 3 dihydrofolate reductase [Vibrio gallicus]|uniref:type 3 dihydrofolate reductase n=1 Tax=Vibrio gallicus TaxID=190897 RepID=UPI0021C3DE56|nr:type 3 dihydrofolate reductase [Vibrio gallicus]